MLVSQLGNLLFYYPSMAQSVTLKIKKINLQTLLTILISVDILSAESNLLTRFERRTIMTHVNLASNNYTANNYGPVVLGHQK